MFTGIIEEVGAVGKMFSVNKGKKLEILAHNLLDGLQPDDSVAVDGICLTVTAVSKNGFEADAVEETVLRTTLGTWSSGKKVNLERAMRADGRFGGHFVQGHVDGTGKVITIQNLEESRLIEIEIPSEYSRYVIEKGSVAIDGVSLTVIRANRNRFSVALIPHTLKKTNLDRLKTGDSVNIETDVLGKYVDKMIHSSGPSGKPLTESRMRELGYSS